VKPVVLPDGLVARASGGGDVGELPSDEVTPGEEFETATRVVGADTDGSRSGGTLAFAVAGLPAAKAGGLEFATLVGRASGFARSVFPGSQRSHQKIARPTITSGPQNRTGPFRRRAGLYLV
jgi:hypothetical protein